MKFKNLRKISTVATMLLTGILVTGTIIANENASTISNALGTTTFKIVKGTSGSEDTEYYKSDFTNVTDLRAAGKKKATEVIEEGSVLLKNDNNALPLAKGSSVTLVGAAAYAPVWGGTGSGTIATSDTVSYLTSFQDAELKTNPTVEAAYTSDDWKAYKRGTRALGGFGNNALAVNDAPWTAFEGMQDSFKTYGDAAIMVIGRIGGEGSDLLGKSDDGVDNNDGLGKDYLGLTSNEISILKGLKALKDAGSIKKIVVLINYSGAFETNFLKDSSYGIDAAMWVGALGIGGEGVGRLLTGAVSPSGRLPDTWWVDNSKNPVNVNYGRKYYSNFEEFGITDPTGGNESTFSTYTVYQEGCYLGYKYTETRYEDVVLGTANAGDYRYDDVVGYPFGYGMSYASFAYDDFSVKKSGDREYTVSVTVTNKSDTVSAKNSVPVFISKPYSDYAKKNGIQVPSVELIDFGKTGALAPGKSETLTMTFDEKYFTSYDSYGTKGYILQEGDYYITVGGSAHDAVNNVLAAKANNGVSVNKDKMDATGDASLVQKFSLNFNSQKYEYSDNTSALDGKSNIKVSNLFDETDINLYSGRGNNYVDYYSRDNWNAVSLDIANGAVKLSLTEQMVKEMYEQCPEESGKYTDNNKIPTKYKQAIPTDDVAYPTYGKSAGLTLVDMMYTEEGKEIDFFDPSWDTFMDQLTWDETKTLISNGAHLTEAIPSIGKVETNDENGPNGFGGWAFGKGYYTNTIGLAYRKEVEAGHVDESGALTDAADQVGYQKMTGFPANGILASTMNKTLAYEVGQIIGEDGIWAGCSNIYGIGLNIHRSQYLGRTCEYFSEDGMLSGLIGAYDTKGIQEHGVNVLNKHCALNDEEDNRHGICCWINEQALRENYLRSFELPITEGGAYGTMASFSRFGTYSGAACKSLSTFLRAECGMKGFIITDAYGDMNGKQSVNPYYEQAYGLYIGACDLPDGNAPQVDDHFAKFEKGYGNMAWAMRTAAKRILYVTAHSNAMNGISSDTKIVSITPWWQTMLVVLDVVFSVAFAGCLVWTGLALLKEKNKQ